MSSSQDSTPVDDPALREVLKRCSPATYYAACKFRTHGRSEDLRTVVVGVVERFVERELRPKLTAQGDGLRLSEDLGIDSLTMMEIVMLAEEVLPVSMSNDELGKLRTLGDVHAFMLEKWATARASVTPGKIPEGDPGWNLGGAVRDDLR